MTTVLRSFLEDSRRPSGTLGYHEVQGFLFAIACAPKRVHDHEWIAMIFGNLLPNCDLEESLTVAKALMDLYESIKAGVVENRPALPDDCKFRPEPIANLEDDAPVSQWSRGLLHGHLWMKESWSAHFSWSDKYFESTFVTLSFFASKQVLETAHATHFPGEDLKVLAEETVLGFPGALKTYANFARRLQEDVPTGTTTLRSFLEDSRRPPGTLRYHELQGFLFAIACAPEPTPTSTWLQKIFAGGDPHYASDKENEAVFDELMLLFDSIDAAVAGGRAVLPRDCTYRPEPLANFEDDAPIAQWSRGFQHGHQWREASWLTHFPKRLLDYYIAVVSGLSSFASKTNVETYCRSTGGDLTAFTETMVQKFPEIFGTYARFGRQVRQAVVRRQGNTPRSPAVVRRATTTTLRAFLDDPHRPHGALRYHEVQGFLFAVVCAPRPVRPDDWVGMVFGGRLPEYNSAEQGDAVIKELMQLYDSINAAVVAGRPVLPGDCGLLADPVANLEQDAPVAQWSRGFLQGHRSLEESWRAHLPQQAHDQFSLVLATLGFFSSHNMVKAHLGTHGCDDLAMMAPTVVQVLDTALGTYAAYGRGVPQLPRRSERAEPAYARKIGRNEPCRCGSGRKYKKCCGVTH